MILYFIRHGQTDWNLQGKIQGSCDTPLNDTGIRQAEDLSKMILDKDYYFSGIYTSKQLRALKTAEIISYPMNLDVIPIDGLEEINFGDWEGLTWSEVEKRYPVEYGIWSQNRRYIRPPRGESYQDLLDRVLVSLQIIIRESHNNVAIVTHSAIIMSLQCYLTDTPFHEMMKFRTPNTAMVEFDSEALTRKLGS